jgi:hypothetical protein
VNIGHFLAIAILVGQHVSGDLTALEDKSFGSAAGSGVQFDSDEIGNHEEYQEGPEDTEVLARY